MELFATYEPTTISETDNPFSIFPTISGNASVIHPDEYGGPHPGVLNEDVLEKVFKHIINRSSSSWKQKRADNIDILKDVRNIRLVCKKWRNVVTLLYRRTQAPTEFDSSNGLKSFLEIMKISDFIPVQDYKFNDGCFRNDTDIELSKDFLLTCGSDIVSLSLYLGNYFVDMFHVRGLADVKLEKLKKLQLDLCNFRPADYRLNDCEPFLELLLDLALEEFKFDSRYSPTAQTKHFVRIICRGLPTTVRILHLSQIRLDEESIAALDATGLKLKEFQLDASCFPGNELAIREFLENQAKTIKTLLIKGERIGETTEFEFPRLNELLCLEMNGISVKPFSIAKTFPKLQTLDVEGWDESILVELLLYERVVLSVKEVIMPVSIERDLRLAKMISKHFPNTTSLRISPTTSRIDMTKTLQEVFIHFPNIEQLYIYNVGLNVDSLFSGVPKASCKRIWEESNFAEVNLMNEQSMPSILNLTKLKKLVVTHDPGFGRFILTDISAHFVFLKMVNLKQLSLQCAEISPYYIELLQKKLYLKIERNFFPDGNSYSDSEDEDEDQNEDEDNEDELSDEE